MITRKSLADEIDTYDQSIADLNAGKKDCFDAYRDQLLAAGVPKPAIKLEVDAVKAAIKRRRLVVKDADAVDEKDALVDEIFVEITSAARAPRATREKTLNNFGSASQSYAEAKGVEQPGQFGTREHMWQQFDAAHGEITDTQEQPGTATRRLDDLGSVQDGLKMSTDGQPKTGLSTDCIERPIEVGVTGGETPSDTCERAAAGSGVTAGETAPHSNPPAQASQALADKTSEAGNPPTASLVAPFNNPRCMHGCHLAHSKDACHECLVAWSHRPKDEQVRLWAEATATEAA